ncbi:uncharacterized protein [Antedon mediterranea]
MMESKPLPPIPKARLVKHAKPNVPTKPTFLRNQQLNKPSNKTLMLITSKDGELSVIKSSNSPPIAPKPKSTFHVRVQQHGNKLQVCPVGHYVEVNSNELEVCSLKNDFYWSILQKNKLEKKELEESCKIEKGVHKSVEVCPIPAPRKISNETSNENTDQSNAEGRHDFENVRANIIPVPSPRSQVNVKLQRRLFEKMLHSKDNEEKSSDILHSNDSSKKTPKKADKLSSKTFSHRRMPSRQTKKYASQQPNKPRPRSMESPSVEFPPKPSSRVRKENTNLQHTDILTDLAKITAAETIPKPSPREMSISMHSKTDNARSAIAPPLSPKPCHRSIPEQPNSKPNFQVSPVEPSSQLILSNVKSKDMPTEDIPKTTANLSNTKKHATTLCAKQNIPKIRISDESSDNQVYCEHLENIEIENIKVTNKRNTEECTTTGVEVDSTIDHKSETSIEHGVLNKSNNQSGNVVIIQNRSESNSDMYPFVVLYPNKSYSDEYTDVEINPDRSKNLSDSGEEPDSDLDDPDYVNCKEDHDDFNEDYVNGDFLDSCSNPAGEYMNFEDAKSCQSTEDNLVEEPPYVNHGISAESCGKDNDALCGDTLEGHKTEENSKKTCGTRTECYEVVLDVSNSKSISNKYRRFSCRQPGRRRKSNFNKQSHLKIDNVDDGSDYKSSQEDITDCLNNEYEEEIVEYSKDEFNDAEEEDEGWQSVDSSDLDHDERTSKRSFHHVLTITPDSTESGVSSGHPSPSRLSSATSDVPRVNSCVSFGSSDGFEDGSVRSSISQFSLSDELEGINTNQSFEDDEFTDNEIYDIMKRESTLSDSVPELDMEALKNDTMIQINKMRKKLAEMKRNVAKKNRRSVSLVSNEGFDLSENVQSSKERNKDVNKLNGRKAVSRKLNVASLSNRNNQGITSAQNNRHGDLQEESVESAIYLSAELDDEEAAKSRRLSMESYVDPDELTTTSRHQALRTMENHASWKLGSDGPPPVPPRTPSLKQLPILSVHNSKTHSAGAVLDSQKQRSKKDLQSRRQSRFVRKEPLFQAYNKDAKLRDTLHFTEYRKQLSVDRDSPPPLPPPRRQSSAVSTLKIGPKSHLLTPEGRSMSLPEIEVENVNRKPSLKMQRTLWCEVPEVAESGILDQIDDKSRKLQEAMFEVITSEASYLRSLDIFLNNFYKADVLSTSYGLIRKEERHHLFSNLISVRDASERLLLDLEDRFQENFMISDVCDIIIKHATQRNFDMYVTYCLNNQYQVKTLKSLKENPTFVTELGILERSKECGGNNLQSFIMLPFQRITRLPLLIDAIIARLEPDSEKIGTAMEALNLVKKVAIKCNEEARRMEGIEEITKLAHKLDYKPNIKAIKISDKLLIVKRGDLQWFSHDTSRFNKKKVVSKQIHVLVFADKVVLTKRKIKNDREVFEVFDWCPRNLVDVKSVELKYDTLVEDYKNVMMVVFLQNHEKKEKKYFINTSSDANFQRWSDALAPPNRSDQGESIYESWDCPQVMCTQAYNAQEPDELSMEESDIIDVLRKTEGWWEGMRVRDSAKGWFPANQVQEIVNDHVRARNLKHRYKVLSVCQEQLQKLQMQGKEV